MKKIFFMLAASIFCLSTSYLSFATKNDTIDTEKAKQSGADSFNKFYVNQIAQKPEEKKDLDKNARPSEIDSSQRDLQNKFSNPQINQQKDK